MGLHFHLAAGVFKPHQCAASGGKMQGVRLCFFPHHWGANMPLREGKTQSKIGVLTRISPAEKEQRL